jgi:hypothetical protein
MDWYSSNNYANYGSTTYAPPTTYQSYGNNFEDEPPLLEGARWLLIVTYSMQCHSILFLDVVRICMHAEWELCVVLRDIY